ncbi:MAG: helix-turn-helix domain-containing protein [Trueperaceae bacterium]|nr:helix-turn-helix domain-containing protein [Trueperaceae bacterium]
MSHEEAFLEIKRLLKEQRKKLGLSQGQIANNYGGDTSQQSIGRYENDPKSILAVLPKARKIFEAYGFDTEQVEYLMKLLYFAHDSSKPDFSNRTVQQAAHEISQEFSSNNDLLELCRRLLKAVEERL